MSTPGFPYRLVRLGTVMEPEPGNELEVEGVLNPGSGWGPDGALYLLPRLVARGNRSRIGLAKVIIDDGCPVGVVREGVVLDADRPWEHGLAHGGVEDPRVTWVPALGLHVMAYAGFGPLGPKPGLAVSEDLRTWQRLGPMLFAYDDELGVDMNSYPNKDVVMFPEAVPDPDGRVCYAFLHRPMWDLGEVRAGAGVVPPQGVEDVRPAVWISYVPVDAVHADVKTLAYQRFTRPVAGGRYDFEQLKIGAGPAPIRVEEGWLLLYHGAVGEIIDSWGTNNTVCYVAAGMILDSADPSTVLMRTSEPLLTPETDVEQEGTVGNVVFPTASEVIDGQRYVFYGMADSRIGVARLERVTGEQA